MVLGMTSLHEYPKRSVNQGWGILVLRSVNGSLRWSRWQNNRWYTQIVDLSPLHNNCWVMVSAPRSKLLLPLRHARDKFYQAPSFFCMRATLKNWGSLGDEAMYYVHGHYCTMYTAPCAEVCMGNQPADNHVLMSAKTEKSKTVKTVALFQIHVLAQ